MKGTCDKNCLLRLKLRLDTPQHYSDIHVRHFSISGEGEFVSIEGWSQYFDLKGQAPPKQQVENVSLEDITGSTTRFGLVSGPPNSSIRDLTLKDINLTLDNPKVVIRNVTGLKEENVKINGSPIKADTSSTP